MPEPKRASSDENRQALIDLLVWHKNRLGSARQLALKTRRADGTGKAYSPQTINSLIETGYATADVLVAVADAIEEPRLRLLLLGGVLKDEDIEAEPMSAADQELMQQVHQLSPRSRATLAQVLQGLLATDRQEGTAQGAA